MTTTRSEIYFPDTSYLCSLRPAVIWRTLPDGLVVVDSRIVRPASRRASGCLSRRLDDQGHLVHVCKSASRVERFASFYSHGLTNPPGFVRDGSQYITVTGSISYGINTDDSDFDTVGFCIPPKTLVFPHLAGEIHGFGRQIQRFEVWEHHRCHDPDALGGRGRTYDFNVYSIVKFFQLAMDNNPNMLRCAVRAARVRAALHEDSRRLVEQHVAPKSFDQMDAALTIAPAVAGALMPDAHLGYGLPIGGVLALDNAVCPYAVGVDIACRMKLSVFEIVAGPSSLHQWLSRDWSGCVQHLQQDRQGTPSRGGRPGLAGPGYRPRRRVLDRHEPDGRLRQGQSRLHP